MRELDKTHAGAIVVEDALRGFEEDRGGERAWPSTRLMVCSRFEVSSVLLMVPAV